jgi:hypothetical protein
VAILQAISGSTWQLAEPKIIRSLREVARVLARRGICVAKPARLDRKVGGDVQAALEDQGSRRRTSTTAATKAAAAHIAHNAGFPLLPDGSVMVG